MCRFSKKAPLLPKLRGYFAEFLQHGSLKCLSILYLFTCVGLGYGLFRTGRIKILPIPLSFFLEVHQPTQSSNSRVTRGLVVAKATSSLLCTHRTKPFRGFLRDRFTLCRFTEHKNPWTFGDHIFHMIYRYSCQHSHFWYLQVLSPTTFFDLQNVPLLTLEKKLLFLHFGAPCLLGPTRIL
jgi:hypothetical protein